MIARGGEGRGDISHLGFWDRWFKYFFYHKTVPHAHGRNLAVEWNKLKHSSHEILTAFGKMFPQICADRSGLGQLGLEERKQLRSLRDSKRVGARSRVVLLIFSHILFHVWQSCAKSSLKLRA